jgi:hypothetical protein
MEKLARSSTSKPRRHRASEVQLLWPLAEASGDWLLQCGVRGGRECGDASRLRWHPTAYPCSRVTTGGIALDQALIFGSAAWIEA